MRYHIKSTRRILDDVFQVDEAQVSFERFDGSMIGPARCLRFVRGDSAAAVVFDRDLQQIVLVQQFRYPTCDAGPGWTTEVIAGSIDPEETPEFCVRREVEEETGYRVGEVSPIATFFVSPGGSTERVFLFYAEVGDADRLSGGGGIAAENEDLRIMSISLEKVGQLLASGSLVDAKTIIGLQWFLGFHKRVEVFR
jgi:ADP-ribose diphosphatase